MLTPPFDHEEIDIHSFPAPSEEQLELINTITIHCGRKIFRPNAIFSSNKFRYYLLDNNKECICILTPNYLVIYTNSSEDLKIEGSLPGLEYVWVKSKGKIYLNLNDTRPDLHLHIYAEQSVTFEAPLKTDGLVALYTKADNGFIKFNDICQFSMALINTKIIDITTGMLKVGRAHIIAQDILDDSKSGIRIGEYIVVPENIGGWFHADVINQLISANSTFKIAKLHCKGTMYFYDVDLFIDKLFVNIGAIVHFNFCQVYTKNVESYGKMIEEYTDIFAEQTVLLQEGSETQMFSSLLCGVNVQQYGKVEFNLPDKSGRSARQSRIISVLASKHTADIIVTAQGGDNIQPELSYERAKQTSINYLWRAFNKLSRKTDNININILPVPANGDCALYTMIISMLYAGIVTNQREGIAKIIKTQYETHNAEVVRSKKYGELKQDDFDKFINDYVSAKEGRVYVDMFDKKSAKYQIVTFLAACARIAIREHAVPAIAELSANEPDKMDEIFKQFLPFAYLNMQYVQNYLADQKINTTINALDAKTEKFIEHPHAKNHKDNTISLRWRWTGNDEACAHYEPELDLLALINTDLPPPVDLKRELTGEQLFMEMSAVFDHYTNGALSLLAGADFKDKLNTVKDKLLKTDVPKDGEELGNSEDSKKLRRTNIPKDDEGVIYVDANAELTGSIRSCLYSANETQVWGKLKNKSMHLGGKSVWIQGDGSVEMEEDLYIDLSTSLKVNGKVQAKRMFVNADHIFGKKGNNITDLNELHIKSLTSIFEFGSTTHSVNINTDDSIHLNFGIFWTWNCENDSAITVPGMYLPCNPRDWKRVVSLRKAGLLLRIGVGYANPIASAAIQTIAQTGSVAYAAQQMYSLYGLVIEKKLSDLTTYDVIHMLKQVKRVWNANMSLYRFLPSMNQAQAMKNAAMATTMQDIKNTCTMENLCGVANNAVAETRANLQYAQETCKQAVHELKDASLPTSFSSFYVTNYFEKRQALKAVAEVAVDGASIFGPMYHSDTGLLLNGGVHLSGSTTSHNLLSLEVLRIGASLNDTNQSVFKHKKTIPTAMFSYNFSSTSGGSYTNAGWVPAVNWSVSTKEYTEYGVVSAATRRLQARNAYIADGAKHYGGGSTNFSVENDLTIAGQANLANGTVDAGNINITETGVVLSKNMHVKNRKSLVNKGRLMYRAFFGLDTDHIATSEQSTITSDDPESLFILNAKTGDIQGAETHYRFEKCIEEMPVEEARDMANKFGHYANHETLVSGKVKTLRQEELVYMGRRTDGIPVELQTGGHVVLPPQYDRARGHQFATYTDAATVEANYANYNLPPPKPPKKNFWRKVSAYVAGALGLASKALASSGEPVAAAAALVAAGGALAVDEAVRKHDDKASLRFQQQRTAIQEAQHRVDSARIEEERKNALAEAERAAQYEALQDPNFGTQRSKLEREKNLGKKNADVDTHFDQERKNVDAQHKSAVDEIAREGEREREKIKKAPGPLAGMGVGMGMGTTGVDIKTTVTTGTPGNTVTSSVVIASIDSSRRGNYNPRSEPRNEPKKEPKRNDRSDGNPNNKPLDPAIKDAISAQRRRDIMSPVYAPRLPSIPETAAVETTTEPVFTQLDGGIRISSLHASNPAAPQEYTTLPPSWVNSVNVIDYNAPEYNRVSNEFIDHLQSDIGQRFTDQQRAALIRQLRVVQTPNSHVIFIKGGFLRLDNQFIIPTVRPSYNTMAVTYGSLSEFTLIDRIPSAPGDMLGRLARGALSRTRRALFGIGGLLRTGASLLFYSPPVGEGETDFSQYVRIDPETDIPAYQAPRQPNSMENIPLPPGTVDNNMHTPVQSRGRTDHVVSEYGSSRATMDRGRLVTPAYDRSRDEGVMLRNIRRYECANGLVYEDAPYHGTRDNPVKSRAPTDPKYALENAVKIKDNSNNRLAFDPANNEIIVLMEHEPNHFHGHVRNWGELEQEHKNILIEKFGFKPNGKRPKNIGR